MSPHPSRRSQGPSPTAPLRVVVRTSDAEAVPDAAVVFEPATEHTAAPALPSGDLLSHLHGQGQEALSAPQRARLLAVLKTVHQGGASDPLEQLALATGATSLADVDALDARLTAAIAAQAKPGGSVDAVVLAGAVGCALAQALEWAMRHRYPLSIADERAVIVNLRGSAPT